MFLFVFPNPRIFVSCLITIESMNPNLRTGVYTQI